jgi:hypothetical protein
MAKQYLVEFYLPQTQDYAFLKLVPKQREQVGKLFASQQLISYTLAADRTKLWLTCIADDFKAVNELIDKLPLSRFMTYTIHELLFNEQIYNNVLPLSLN